MTEIHTVTCFLKELSLISQNHHFLSSLVNHGIALHCFFSLPSQHTNRNSVFLWSKRYLLQPKGNGSKSKSDDLGSLRLKLTYIEDTVLPSACYTPLCNLLLKSPDVKVGQLLELQYIVKQTEKKEKSQPCQIYANVH